MAAGGHFSVWPTLIVVLIAVCATTTSWAQGTEPLPETVEPHRPHVDEALNWCALHIARGEYKDARVDCDIALDHARDNPRAYSNRGSLNLLVHDFAKALADFNQALRLAPEDATLYFNRGLALAKLGRGPEAIADYTTATNLKPDLAIAYHNRGYEYELQGQPDRALADFRRALNADPGLRQSQQAINRLERQL